MATLGELVVKVNADIKGLRKGMDAATGAIRQMNADVRRAGIGLTVALTATATALGASVGAAAADMDSLKRGLDAVAGSTAAADAQLKRLEDVAKLPGLGFREAIQGSVRLQAVGLNAALAERALRSFGNAVALTGGGKNELDRITVQLGQLAGKGKVLAQDMRLIMDAAPATGRALRDAFGTVDTEAIQKLGLTSEQFITRLLDALDRLPRVTGGVKNSFENLTDSLFRAKVAIGNQLLPAIVPLVEGLTSLLESVRTLDPNMIRWGIAIAGVAAVAGPLVLTLSGVTTAVTALATALGVGLLPVIAIGGPVLIALAAISAMWAKNKLDALAAAAATDRYKASLVGLTEGQLTSHRIAETLRHQDAKITQDALRRSGRAFERGFNVEGPLDAWRRGGIGGLLMPRREPVVVETRAMRALGNEANDAAAKVHAIDSALGLLHTTASRPLPPIIPPGGGGTEKFAGLLDGLTDRLRELQALQSFGVPSLNLLPDDAADQIRLVNSLAGELDTLTDGLNRFRQAGRTPPSGLTWGIETLTKQLEDAGRELDRLAQKWAQSRDRMSGRVDVRLPEVQVSPGAETVAVNTQGVMPSDAAKGLDEMSRAAKFAGETLKGVAVDVKSALSSGLQQIVAGSSQFAGNAIRIGDMMLKGGQSFAKAAPQALGIAAALEVMSGAMNVIGPVITALTLPLRIMGEVLGMLIVPVLRILWQPMKILGIVVSYLGEIIAKVAGAIANAIGQLVRGLGRLINKLPGSPGDPLVKAGQAMIDLGKEFRDAAKDMEARRKELQKLSFDDAVNGVDNALDKLTESLTNVPPLFNLALRRLQAAGGGMPSVPAGGGLAPPSFTPPTTTEPRTPVGPTINLNFNENAIRGGGNATEVAKEVIRLAAGALERVSDSSAREMGLTLRMAVS